MKNIVNPKSGKEKKRWKEKQMGQIKKKKKSKTVNPTILVITFNVNGLNTSIKRQSLSDCLQFDLDF